MKIIEAKEAFFFYNPNVDEFTLYSGVKFTYNIKDNKFQIDINPNGESRVVNINNKKTTDSLDKLSFDATYKGKNNQYIVKSDFKTCRYIFDIVNTFNQPINTTEDLSVSPKVFTRKI